MGGEQTQRPDTPPKAPDPGDLAGRSNDDAVFMAVMSGEQVTPAAAAQAMRSHPAQRNAMMTTIQQRFGNAFAQQVVVAMNGDALLHGPAPAPDPTPSIVASGTKLADTADSTLTSISTLLAAYTRARDALDGKALAEIGSAVLGALEVVAVALGGIDKQLARRPTMPEACGPGGDPTAEMEHVGALGQLDAIHTRRTVLQVTSDGVNTRAAQTFTPMTFRGQPIPDVVMPPLELSKEGHFDARRRGFIELNSTSALIEIAEKLGMTFADPAARHDPTKRMDAQMQLRQISHRPMDFAFMRAVLMGTGLWFQLNTEDGMPSVPGTGTTAPEHHGPLDNQVCSDDGPLTALYTETKQRAAQTGWSNNVGLWDQDMAVRWIRMGGTEAYVTVGNQILSASPEGKVEILKQIQTAGLFDRLFDGLPWKYTKEIHDGLPYGYHDLKHALQPHFLTEDKWGTNLEVQNEHAPSVHQMLENAQDNVGGIGGHAIGAAESVYNFLTFGFERGYGEATDAYHAGEISDGDYDQAMRQITTRAVVSMAFMMATAGAVRSAQMAPLPNLMTAGAAPTGAQVAMMAGVEGATWGTAEMAMLDIGDLSSGAKTQSSSMSDYLLALLLSGGAAAGSAALAHYLGSRGARYVDPSQRTRGQQMGLEDPQLAPVVDKFRGAAPGTVVKVRVNADEAYAMREAGLIDADTHRALREKLATMPEIEVDVRVVKSLDEPHARPSGPNGKPAIYDAPSLQIENTGPVSGQVPQPTRTARPNIALRDTLPKGVKVLETNGDEWVKYEMPDGSERIRFRSRNATVGTPEPKPGRNYSTPTTATVMSNGQVAVTEGVHRTVGSSQGDVIGSDVGGVRQQPGVLDYDYRHMGIDPSEVHPASSRKIDYSQSELSTDDALAARKKRGWE